MADPRPTVPVKHSNPEEHRRQLAERANASLPKDGTQSMQSPLPMKSYAIADLPDASMWEGALVYVTDDVGGAVPAFSDGTDWRRVTDRSVVSTS